MTRHTHLQLNLEQDEVEMLKIVLGKFRDTELLTDKQYLNLRDIHQTVGAWLASRGDSNGRN